MNIIIIYSFYFLVQFTIHLLLILVVLVDLLLFTDTVYGV